MFFRNTPGRCLTAIWVAAVVSACSGKPSGWNQAENIISKLADYSYNNYDYYSYYSYYSSYYSSYSKPGTAQTAVGQKTGLNALPSQPVAVRLIINAAESTRNVRVGFSNSTESFTLSGPGSHTFSTLVTPAPLLRLLVRHHGASGQSCRLRVTEAQSASITAGLECRPECSARQNEGGLAGTITLRLCNLDLFDDSQLAAATTLATAAGYEGEAALFFRGLETAARARIILNSTDTSLRNLHLYRRQPAACGQNTTQNEQAAQLTGENNLPGEAVYRVRPGHSRQFDFNRLQRLHSTNLICPGAD